VHRFRGQSKVSTWLYRTARNVYLSNQRRQRREEDLQQQAGGELQRRGTLDRSPPEERLEQGQRRRVVEEALSRLPEDYRTAILLKEVEELSHAAMAEIMGKSVAASKVLLHRAKARFKEEYHRLEGE